jgi:hypothetical protein
VAGIATIHSQHRCRCLRPVFPLMTAEHIANRPKQARRVGLAVWP